MHPEVMAGVQNSYSSNAVMAQTIFWASSFTTDL